MYDKVRGGPPPLNERCAGLEFHFASVALPGPRGQPFGCGRNLMTSAAPPETVGMSARHPVGRRESHNE